MVIFPVCGFPYTNTTYFLRSTRLRRGNLLTHSGITPTFCRWALYSASKMTHDDVIKWNHFPRYWSFGHRWIPLTKGSDAELWCFLCSPGQTVEQTEEVLVIWDAIALIVKSQLWIYHITHGGGGGGGGVGVLCGIVPLDNTYGRKLNWPNAWAIIR